MLLPPSLQDTQAGLRLKAIDELYQEFQKEMTTFELAAKHQSLNCPPGCGQCCVGFDPDVLASESLAIALHIITSGSADLAHRVSQPVQEGTCLFYEANSPYHCQIYQARPLICRGFGFSSSQDKEGQAVFRYCRHMPTEGTRVLQGQRMSEAFEQAPPSLTHWGQKLHGLFPEDMATKDRLSQVILTQMNRLQFLISLTT